MATEALEHAFFKGSSSSQGSGSPGGRGSHHSDELHSNPLQQVEGDAGHQTTSWLSVGKEANKTSTKEEEVRLLEASQDSGVGAQLDVENDDIEESQEVEKQSSFNDSLLVDSEELDCREPEDWGWDVKELTPVGKPQVGQEGAASPANPPAKRVKYECT